MTDRARYDVNNRATLIGVSATDPSSPTEVWIDPTTHGMLMYISGGTLSGTSSNLYTGQKTVNTSAVQVSVASHTLSNGVILKAPSTNSANIYVGLTGVTTSTGDILEPGESRGYPVNNTNLLYIISASSTTDVVSFEGN